MGSKAGLGPRIRGRLVFWVSVAGAGVARWPGSG